LEALPGVGPALAARIIAWRTQHGRFSSVAELDSVSGIGPALLAKLGPLLKARR
jgi:competence protein ComEA